MTIPNWMQREREARKRAADLQERFEYLKRGGEWQKTDECEAPSEYARGFLDAMRILGVEP